MSTGIGIDLEKITLGTSALGKRPDANAELAHLLVGAPFRQLDTSNNYANGESERLLGEAIRDAGGLPAHQVLFSKVDQDPETGAFDGDRVWRSWEESTSRLGLERLPLLHLHDPYTITLAEAFAPGGAVEALRALKEQGLVGAIGIAAGTRALVEDYVRSDAFDAVLTHNRYTLVDRSGLGIIAAATERGMTVFNAAPFGGGILAGSDVRGATYGYKPASDELLAFIDSVHALCREWDVPVAAAALGFSFAEPRIHSTVVGIYSAARLAELPDLVATASALPDGFLDAIAALGDPPATAND